MDYSAISGGIAALGTALDLARGAVTIRDAVQLNAAVVVIQEKLLEAQRGLFEHNTQLMQLQQDHYNALEEIRQLKAARAKGEQYRLAEVGEKKAILYESTDDGKLKHFACPPCLDKNNVISVLQPNGTAFLWCPVCKVTYRINPDRPLSFRRG